MISNFKCWIFLQNIIHFASWPPKPNTLTNWLLIESLPAFILQGYFPPPPKIVCIYSKTVCLQCARLYAKYVPWIIPLSVHNSIFWKVAQWWFLFSGRRTWGSEMINFLPWATLSCSVVRGEKSWPSTAEHIHSTCLLPSSPQNCEVSSCIKKVRNKSKASYTGKNQTSKATKTVFRKS